MTTFLSLVGEKTILSPTVGAAVDAMVCIMENEFCFDRTAVPSSRNPKDATDGTGTVVRFRLDVKHPNSGFQHVAAGSPVNFGGKKG